MRTGQQTIASDQITMNRIGYLLILFLLLGVGCAEIFVVKSNSISPLPRANESEMKLTFGLYVTPDPDMNPIDPPERFEGFHAGLDYEIFDHELTRDVPVTTICEGTIIYSDDVNGYGGVVIEKCEIQGEIVTVLYGHVDPRSAVHNVNDNVEMGEQIAVLAPNKSPQSDDNRKHLHLSIHKGESIELRGYVQSEGELADFLNPAEVLGY